MDRKDLRRVKEILGEIQGVRRSIQKEMDTFKNLFSELQNLFIDNSDIGRLIDQEDRYLRSMNSKINDFSLDRRIKRRIPDIESDIKDQERSNQVVQKQTKKTGDTLNELQRFLKKIKN